ncbi:AEC family transporter [Methylococcus sp. EFPC2]|uniref:AEC family transporter n=1 Tax=Methylococcus sp. EFPC2 TaxID=2812648 RepID=UPI001966D7D4|nr:AEC family transporter [Methylococcus sp. EFPC2]QSA98842.1 AEC family transporter [Methylococcus sp. EFPC2]
MYSVLGQMGLLIVCGAAVGIIRPGGLSADQIRQVLTTLVFNLLLPALVLSVLWRAELGWETLKISIFGVATILFGAGLTWLVSRVVSIDRRRLGAAMLAITFANVTYLGLPVLEQTFGTWSRALVIQIDLFASFPMVLTLGNYIGRHYGEDGARQQPASILRALLGTPPLLTALLALTLNLSGTPYPAWLDGTLSMLSGAVIPLMLISLGLGLRWDAWHWRNLPLGSVVLVGKLLLMPLFGLWLGLKLGFEGDKLSALVMESGMPSMLLGVVYCDRWRLDTGFYAMIVALTTAGALLTLPLWRHLP